MIYDDKSVLIKRKSMYLLAFNYFRVVMSTIMAIIYHAMGIFEIYFYAMLIITSIMAYLVVKGRMDIALIAWALIILDSTFDYYPSIPAGLDVGVTVELIFIFSLWTLISYKMNKKHLDSQVFFVYPILYCICCLHSKAGIHLHHCHSEPLSGD